MSRQRARNLGIVILVVSSAVYVASLLLLALTGQPLSNTTVWATPSLTMLVVSAIIVSHQPESAIGWLGFVAAQPIGPFGDTYATTVLVHHAASLPGAQVMAWFGYWLSSPTPLLPLAMMVMLFPNGHPASRRWRTVFRLTVAWAVILLTCCAFSPVNTAGDLAYSNPLAAPGAIGRLLNHCQEALWLLVPLFGVLTVWSLISRYRSAGSEERQQLKWLLWAVGALVANIVLLLAISWLALAAGAKLPWIIGSIAQYSVLVGVLAIIAAVAVAMLKYHLYDIDLIINRTIVYVVLTAGLILSYTGCVLLLQNLFSPITQRSDLAIALSTLAVAGLFHPARSRIQNAVDRRFYRQKYDAEHALERFGTRAREEVNLEELTGALANVIAETVQPVSVTVWVRQPEVRRWRPDA